jgi:hypothetical protein
LARKKHSHVREKHRLLAAWCGVVIMAALAGALIGAEFGRRVKARHAPVAQAPTETSSLTGVPIEGVPLEIDGRPTPVTVPLPARPAPPAPVVPPAPQGRIEFEIRTNQSRYVAPEIAIGINGADEARQRVSGWIRFSSDQKPVWLENRYALHPVFVRSPKRSGTFKLVFTRVTNDRVAGYLLMPTEEVKVARSRPQP